MIAVVGIRRGRWLLKVILGSRAPGKPHSYRKKLAIKLVVCGCSDFIFYYDPYR